uniref:Secreted protein n=1 Tax=Macrostomum lignano TaxID=282301 RepID=A0A1I8IPC8_9PLAT
MAAMSAGIFGGIAGRPAPKVAQRADQQFGQRHPADHLPPVVRPRHHRRGRGLGPAVRRPARRRRRFS